MTKTKQDNDMIDRIGAIYIENDAELSSLSGPSAVSNKNQIGQQHD